MLSGDSLLRIYVALAVVCAFVALLVVVVPFNDLNQPKLSNVGDPLSNRVARSFNVTSWLCDDTRTSRNSTTRLLFIGDSQTRYLFSQFASALFNAPTQCWWAVTPSTLPRPLSPRTRFAFSWVTQQWPPQWWVEQAAILPPIMLGYIAMEYASNETWVVDTARRFQPTHVLVGRGCWDMIRRRPAANRIDTMCKEFWSLAMALSTFAQVKCLLLFPALRITYAKPLGNAASIDTQKRRSPWTSCLIETYQDYFHHGLVACIDAVGATLRRTHSDVNVLVVEAADETRAESAHPADGIHYDDSSVVQKLFSKIAAGIDGEVSNSAQQSPAARLTEIAKTDLSIEHALLRHKRCGGAAASYGASVTLLVETALRDFIEVRSAAGSTCDSGLLRLCTEVRYALWRYLGPWPWSAGGDDQPLLIRATVLCNACFNEARVNRSLRMSLVRLFAPQHHEGNGSVCKLSFIATVMQDAYSGGERDDMHALPPSLLLPFHHNVRCLNEPFGGRP